MGTFGEMPVSFASYAPYPCPGFVRYVSQLGQGNLALCVALTFLHSCVRQSVTLEEEEDDIVMKRIARNIEFKYLRPIRGFFLQK